MTDQKIEVSKVVDIIAAELEGVKVSHKTKQALTRVAFKVTTGVLPFDKKRLEEAIELLEERGREVREEQAEQIRQSIERGR